MPMQKNYTTENLIRFIYRETSEAESIQLMHAILHDDEMAEEFQQLSKLIESFDEVKMEPSATSLKIVMDHCRSGIHAS